MGKKVIKVICTGLILFGLGYLGGYIGGVSKDYIKLFLEDPYIIFPYDILYGFFLIVIVVSYAFFYRSIYSYKSILKDKFIDEDMATLKIEKGIFHITSLAFFICAISFIWLLFSFSQLIQSLGSISSYIVFNTIVSGIIFVISCVTQWYAIKLHNIRNSDNIVDFFSTDSNKDYLEKIDDGEKFETYRLSFIVYNKMNTVFLLALFLLFFYGLFFTFYVFPFLLVAILWIVMNGLYYLEGYKSYGTEGNKLFRVFRNKTEI